jgi:hypothetical protein
VKHSGAPYAIKLLRTANQLLTKKKKQADEFILLDYKERLNELKERVYLKILEDCDNPSIVSNDTLVQSCLLFDEFQFDSDQARTIKEVYNQILYRGLYLTPF